MIDRLDPSLARLDRSAFELVFAEDFTAAALHADRWVGHYLPHWTAPERSTARYAFDDSGLRLLIDVRPAGRTPRLGRKRNRHRACGPGGRAAPS